MRWVLVVLAWASSAAAEPCENWLRIVDASSRGDGCLPPEALSPVLQRLDDSCRQALKYGVSLATAPRLLQPRVCETNRMLLCRLHPARATAALAEGTGPQHAPATRIECGWALAERIDDYGALPALSRFVDSLDMHDAALLAAVVASWPRERRDLLIDLLPRADQAHVAGRDRLYQFFCDDLSRSSDARRAMCAAEPPFLEATWRGEPLGGSCGELRRLVTSTPAELPDCGDDPAAWQAALTPECRLSAATIPPAWLVEPSGNERCTRVRRERVLRAMCELRPPGVVTRALAALPTLESLESTEPLLASVPSTVASCANAVADITHGSEELTAELARLVPRRALVDGLVSGASPGLLAHLGAALRIANRQHTDGRDHLYQQLCGIGAQLLPHTRAACAELGPAQEPLWAEARAVEYRNWAAAQKREARTAYARRGVLGTLLTLALTAGHLAIGYALQNNDAAQWVNAVLNGITAGGLALGTIVLVQRRVHQHGLIIVLEILGFVPAAALAGGLVGYYGSSSPGNPRVITNAVGASLGLSIGLALSWAR